MLKHDFLFDEMCVSNERFKAKSKKSGNMSGMLIASELVSRPGLVNASEHLNSTEKVAHSVDCGVVLK